MKSRERGITMLFNHAHKFLRDMIIGKIMTMEELSLIVCSAECFDPIDGYFLSNCIIQEKEQCSFNSNENNNGTKVINIDISFLHREDFTIIKEMSWDEESECNNMKIKIEDVYIYNL